MPIFWNKNNCILGIYYYIFHASNLNIEFIKLGTGHILRMSYFGFLLEQCACRVHCHFTWFDGLRHFGGVNYATIIKLLKISYLLTVDIFTTTMMNRGDQIVKCALWKYKKVQFWDVKTVKSQAKLFAW